MGDRKYHNERLVGGYIDSFLEITSESRITNINQQKLIKLRFEKFEIPSVKIRLNVLYSETLRLADMASINNISEEEIKNENENILNAFSALNLKINNIIIQENLNKDLNEFIEEIKSTTTPTPEEIIPKGKILK